MKWILFIGLAILMPMIGRANVMTNKTKCKNEYNQIYFKLKRLQNKYGQDVSSGEKARVYNDLKMKQKECNSLKACIDSKSNSVTL